MLKNITHTHGAGAGFINQRFPMYPRLAASRRIMQLFHHPRLYITKMKLFRLQRYMPIVIGEMKVAFNTGLRRKHQRITIAEIIGFLKLLAVFL